MNPTPTVSGAAVPSPRDSTTPRTHPSGRGNELRGGGRGKGRGRSDEGARGGYGRGRFYGRNRGGARYQGSVSRTTYSVSDGKYQESLILGVGVAVRKEQYRSGYIQNYLGEYGEIARTIDSTFQHPYDQQGLTKEDAKLPSVDEFDFLNDPAAKVRYDQVCQERKDLAEFFRKRAFLHGKIQAQLTQEVHDRMMDQYPPEFFGGETPTWILFDAILEKMVPVGIDKREAIQQLKKKRIFFRMRSYERPREYVARAKELRAEFEVFSEPFNEEDFVNEIAIPGLQPEYAEVAEQRKKFYNYPIPDPNDVLAMAQYNHLVQPVKTLDQLTQRLQMVEPRQHPLEYINAAVQQDNERKRKRDTGRGRGSRGRGRSGRIQQVPQEDRVVCHKCGLWGHRRKNCPKKDEKEILQFFEEEY